jgi:hypothetical protein
LLPALSKLLPDSRRASKPCAKKDRNRQWRILELSRQKIRGGKAAGVPGPDRHRKIDKKINTSKTFFI